MEDTKSLLVMVLQKIFTARPKIVDETFQIIYQYNNGTRERNEYEKTLKTICDLMNDELPSEILVYLLTLVDMPLQAAGSQLPIIEKMQKTQNCMPERVRPHLLEYLRNCVGKVVKTELPRNVVKPPLQQRKRRGRKRAVEVVQRKPLSNNPLSLLDLTAKFVVRNESKLKAMYRYHRMLAWKLINSKTTQGKDLKQCYRFLEDLNKKSKLLRMIEDNNITEDCYFDEYQTSEVFLKEKHLSEQFNYDPFNLYKSIKKDVSESQ